MKDPYKIALCQMLVGPEKDENMKRAAACIEEAARNGAQIVCLPEIWNCPYDGKLFSEYAEEEDGPAATLMSGLAKAYGIYLVGGSIPEKAGAVSCGEDPAPKIYNTSFVFDRGGSLIAKHRKVHLFDVDIKNGIRFKESAWLSAGDSLTVFDTDLGRAGLAICFDVRFPDMFKEMAKDGASIVFLPASFNMTTGPAHWDLLIKSRALDNQIYVAACASARNQNSSYISWGHSCVATPWGEYCAAADANESIVYATISEEYMNRIRMEIPVGN